MPSVIAVETSLPQETKVEKPIEIKDEKPTDPVASKLEKARTVKDEVKQKIPIAAKDALSARSLRQKLNDELSAGYWRVEREIERLDKLPKVKKLLSLDKRKQLLAQKARIQESITTSRQDSGEQDFSGIEKDCRLALSEYEDFSEKTANDPELLQTVRRTIISKASTELENLVTEGKISSEEADELLSGSSSDRVLDRMKREIKDKDLRELIISFNRGKDQEVFKLIVKYGVQKDLEELKSALPGDSPNALKRIVNQIAEKVQLNDVEIKTLFGNINVVEALKDSSLGPTFQELLKDTDSFLYNKSLQLALLNPDNSLYADVLAHYHTPEAIRNLIIIAGGDGKNGYVGNTANWCLRELAKRPDWNDILDKTEETYPDVKKVRPVLQNWSWSGMESNPQLRSAMVEFSLNVLRDEEKNQGAVKLARESLPLEALCEHLSEKGILDRKDFEIIKRVYSSEEIEYSSFRRVFKDRLTEGKEVNGLIVLFQAATEDPSNVKYLTNINLIKSVLRGDISPEIAIILPKEAPFFFSTFSQNYPEVSQETLSYCLLNGKDLFQNPSDIQSLDKLAQAFGENLTNSTLGIVLRDKKISVDLASQLPKEAPLFMNKDNVYGRSFILENGNLLVQDINDLRFLNGLVGEFGQKYDLILRGYCEAIKAGVITKADKDLVLEFARQFKVISPQTIEGYRDAKAGGYKDVYIADLRSLAEKLTGSSSITEAERAKPYYKDLIKHVYPHNSGTYTTYESNESCNDRSADLSGFKIKPRYEIDLLSEGEIRVKEGEKQDPKVQEDVKKPILEVSEKMRALGYDNEKIKADLGAEIDKNLEEILAKGGLEGITINSLKTPEEKLFLIMTDTIYGSKILDKNLVKDLLITYEFANFEDVKDYISGTTDRVSRARNQGYALLCEIDSFYSDRIKEVNRRLVQEAWKNPQIAKTMPDYFRKLANETITSERQEQINKLQVGRLGMSESFVKQLAKLLEKRKGRKYDLSEVREIARRYESITEGLQGKSSTSQKPETRAFYGQLRSQREKTFDALKLVAGQEVDPKKIHLDEVNLQDVLDTEVSIKEEKYNEEQFASYTVQRFIDLFDEERSKIGDELDKYESLSGKQREVLYGYISKTKETANARMVGGVCVSGDNPDKGSQNMWDMPNYLQLVLQDPETKQCQGLVLLHTFTQEGKKVLTASFDPSSTYLYSVDEAGLFTGLLRNLSQFAEENNFDIIATSRNKTIRTNRTGGQFERAIDERVGQVNKTFRFNSPVQFSYRLAYQLQDMDVVWEKPTAS